LSSSPPVRAVIFDLGGVILESPFDVLDAYERELGIRPGTLARITAYAALDDGPWQRLERGEIDLATFCEAFDERLVEAGVGPVTAPLMARITERLVVRDPMLGAVRALRRRYTVAALTNIWDSRDGLSRTLDALRREFDVFAESWRLGVRKPEPAIYRETCRRIGIAPEQAVFVDDIGANLKPARALGMRTIKFSSVEQTLADLGVVLGA
jgi:putative hydrolase of the HAD superfamily